MTSEVIMPALEMGQEGGTIVSWLKREGETVAPGDSLVEIETDKTVTTIEAQIGGVLQHVGAQPGDVVPVGQVIAHLGPRSAPGDTPPTHVAAAGSVAPGAHAAGRNALASPAARRLARDRGIDLRGVRGTGPNGAVRAGDIPDPATQKVAPSERAKAAPSRGDTSPTSSRAIPLKGSRRVMAERLQRSHGTAPSTTQTLSVDMGQVRGIIEEARERDADRPPTTTAVVATLLARVLRRHPRLNSHVSDDQIVELEEIRLGIAVARTDDVIVPVIGEADRKSIAEVASELRTLAERARARKIQPDEVRGSTFTLTSLDSTDVEEFRPILNPPEAGILAIARTVDTPVVRAERVEVRPIMRATLVTDHRAVDGLVAATFLGELKRVLECPGLLLL